MSENACELARGLEDLSDTLNVCGNDHADVLLGAARLLRSKGDEAAYLRCQVRLLTDQVERLRLTDEERDAVEWASKTLCVGWHDLAPSDKQRTRDAAATLRSLLKRISAT